MGGPSRKDREFKAETGSEAEETPENWKDKLMRARERLDELAEAIQDSGSTENEEDMRNILQKAREMARTAQRIRILEVSLAQVTGRKSIEIAVAPEEEQSQI